jgi:hypothetical protein
VIDGVQINLQHELLNPSEWSGDPFSTPQTRRDPNRPFIWFPRFGDFDMTALRRKAKRVFASRSKNISSARGSAEIGNPVFDEYVRTNTPDGFAYAGDKICVDEVKIVKVGDRFDHLHNAEMRYAYLRIERSNGDVQILPTPLRFKGEKNIVHSATSDVSYLISQHICEHFGLKNLGDAMPILKDDSYAYRALLEARHLEIELEPIRKIVYGGRDLLSDAYQDLYGNLAIANDAALMGYLWAKAEAELNVKPRLDSQLQKSSLGGKNSAKKRWYNKERLKQIVRNAADAVWRTNRTYSQHDVAVSIQNRWLEIVGPRENTPVVSTIKKYLKGMTSPDKMAKRMAQKKR